jgi:hypothetical protein
MGRRKSAKTLKHWTRCHILPVSYDPESKTALESIAYWRGRAMVKAFFEVNFPDPRKIDESAQEVGMDTMEKMVLVISFANEVIRSSTNMLDQDLLKLHF